mmetsp:Transcript_6353/g.15454  ORF Transcript_6353/g.15454 Transcript_6353/m.15454 type:complete len:289 (-) Transcript_6353:293-1159(-)
MGAVRLDNVGLVHPLDLVVRAAERGARGIPTRPACRCRFGGGVSSSRSIFHNSRGHYRAPKIPFIAGGGRRAVAVFAPVGRGRGVVGIPPRVNDVCYSLVDRGGDSSYILRLHVHGKVVAAFEGLVLKRALGNALLLGKHRLGRDACHPPRITRGSNHSGDNDRDEHAEDRHHGQDQLRLQSHGSAKIRALDWIRTVCSSLHRDGSVFDRRVHLSCLHCRGAGHALVHRTCLRCVCRRRLWYGHLRPHLYSTGTRNFLLLGKSSAPEQRVATHEHLRANTRCCDPRQW